MFNIRFRLESVETKMQPETHWPTHTTQIHCNTNDNKYAYMLQHHPQWVYITINLDYDCVNNNNNKTTIYKAHYHG